MALIMIINVRKCLIFSSIFDTTSDFFTEQVDSLPKLTPLQLKKLKHLTIVSLAAKDRVSGHCGIGMSLFILNSILILHAVNSLFHVTTRIRH
jgi:hypothetical protein